MCINYDGARQGIHRQSWRERQTGFSRTPNPPPNGTTPHRRTLTSASVTPGSPRSFSPLKSPFLHFSLPAPSYSSNPSNLPSSRGLSIYEIFRIVQDQGTHECEKTGKVCRLP